MPRGTRHVRCQPTVPPSARRWRREPGAARHRVLRGRRHDMREFVGRLDPCDGPSAPDRSRGQLLRSKEDPPHGQCFVSRGGFGSCRLMVSLSRIWPVRTVGDDLATSGRALKSRLGRGLRFALRAMHEAGPARAFALVLPEAVWTLRDVSSLCHLAPPARRTCVRGRRVPRIHRWARHRTGQWRCRCVRLSWGHGVPMRTDTGRAAPRLRLGRMSVRGAGNARGGAEMSRRRA
jgi:hypothetical protein